MFTSVKLAVFIDGDFWHGYLWKNRGRVPIKQYWKEKIAGNMARDKRVNGELKKLGWKVIRIWEHDVMKLPQASALKVLKAYTGLKKAAANQREYDLRCAQLLLPTHETMRLWYSRRKRILTLLCMSIWGHHLLQRELLSALNSEIPSSSTRWSAVLSTVLASGLSTNLRCATSGQVAASPGGPTRLRGSPGRPGGD